MKENTKMTTRIWKGSLLIKKRVKYINQKFDGVNIIKVKRGSEASDNLELIVEEGDYITFIGDSNSCLDLFKETGVQHKKQE